MRRLLRPLWILLALVFLFEAWLWERLKPIVGWFVDWIPWDAFKAHVAAGIERLPPLATLLVFLVPVVLLLPIKFVGLWLLAHGLWFGAMATLGLAKVVSMGVTAFIFDLTRPKLLQLCVVPLALRARPGVDRLGARPDRSDQGADARNGCGCSLRSARAARCDCCGASAAARGCTAADDDLRTNAPRAARTARSP